MKTKLVATVLLPTISLLLVLGSTSYAQSFGDHQPINQQTISNTVYLPLVSKPPCTYVHPTAYVAVSKPVVRVGEIVTVTSAIVNDCAPLSHIAYYLETQPEGILYPSRAMQYGYPPSILNDSHQEMTFTVQAVADGVVTVSVSVGFLLNDPHGWWSGAVASPSIMRVLP